MIRSSKKDNNKTSFQFGICSTGQHSVEYCELTNNSKWLENVPQANRYSPESRQFLIVEVMEFTGVSRSLSPFLLLILIELRLSFFFFLESVKVWSIFTNLFQAYIWKKAISWLLLLNKIWNFVLNQNFWRWRICKKWF